MSEKETGIQVGTVCEETYISDWQIKATRCDRLLIRMNHEIRTAMNVILGMTDVIRETELSPILGDNIRVTRASAERLVKESTEIIDLIRAEMGNLHLCSTSFSLYDTLQQAMDPMVILANSNRIMLKYHISPQTPSVVIGDAGRLCQILTTLLRAAIDRLDRGEIWVNLECNSHYVGGVEIKCSVVDNGPRIPPEKISGMLDSRLYQETDIRDGSELALLLARYLAEMMGGHLWADAEPEAGATFRFNVNLRPAPTVDLLRVLKAGEQTRTDRRPLKILVADDSADNLLLIRTFLKDAPWGIESANNGRAALEMAACNSYDLILMDLDMPEMNGYSATRNIRMSESYHEIPPVPIVALTAHNEAEAAAKCIEAGCTAHVTKPIHKAALIETIQRYASGHNSPGARIVRANIPGKA